MKTFRAKIILCSLLSFILLGCDGDDIDRIENIPMENIANENFKRYLLENFDTDKDGLISLTEAEAVTEMNCPGFSGLYSLDGIQYFTNLKVFKFSNGTSDVRDLDLSKNTKLEELYCSNSHITSLNLSKNIALRILDCSNNKLTTLVLPESLEVLNCSDNDLTSLDITKCVMLKSLNCSDMKITSLDLTKCTMLNSLNSFDCNITALDLVD